MSAKYLQIAADLTKKIKQGPYIPGSFLPSEPNLTALYHVSRETIRKALNELMLAGLIQKIKGKGSIVLSNARFSFPISNITSFDELNQQEQMHATTRVLALHDSHLPINISQELNLTDTAATYIARLRSVNHEPIVIDEDYILKKYVPQLSKQVAENSLYSYFEQELGLAIDYATKAITVEPASNKIINQLQLTDTNLVVVVRSLTYLKDTSFFQYTVASHRPDKFKFIDFARRKTEHGGFIL
ncbi:transcriptional regulator, GntR family [Lactobacillus bombicola]|uniref:Trehalose operon repressor n=1 Tax=Lactobacillus bombicola TaxID=1505723 RepID=A0A1I1TVU0_9LACO|nr:trehalose operon repressor [Lactobacillus bombicola]MCO6528680.1 trehalose operon repressor [Lactobacillus sp.]SFD62624.1 transcriptional regulator, GntR family [Lactobacillus bombicola]